MEAHLSPEAVKKVNEALFAAFSDSTKVNYGAGIAHFVTGRASQNLNVSLHPNTFLPPLQLMLRDPFQVYFSLLSFFNGLMHP